MSRTCLLTLAIGIGLAGCSSGSDPVDPPDDGPPQVVSIRITPSVPTIEIPGQLTTLRANARDAAGGSVGGQTYSWTSSAPDVVTIDANGTATAVSVGSATISASTAGVTGTVELQVTGIRSLTFLNGSWTLDTGDGAGATATSAFQGLRAGIFEEVRERDGAELLRAPTRVEPDGVTWLYGRADGVRARIQYFSGTLEAGQNRAVATSADGMNRVILENVSTAGFDLRLQAADGPVWTDLRTEEYRR